MHCALETNARAQGIVNSSNSLRFLLLKEAQEGDNNIYLSLYHGMLILFSRALLYFKKIIVIY